MIEAKLSSDDNFAIATFHNGKGDILIVVGNVPEGSVPSCNDILRSDALEFFGTEPKEAGSAKGSRPGRWECWITVDAAPDRVQAFIEEKLGGGPNQMARC